MEEPHEEYEYLWKKPVPIPIFELEKKPEGRYPSTGALLQALEDGR